MPGKISASMMCANFLELKQDILDLEASGIEYLHFDIMDGCFVPNYALGPCVLEQIRSFTRIPFDIHFMVEKPEEKLRFFDIREGDYVTVHYEAAKHLQRLLTEIRSLGAAPGVAINPATPFCLLQDILDDTDFILLMTVNPGFAGQKMVPGCLEKIRRLKAYLAENGHESVEIEVDGNVSFENAKLMREAGADIFVAGSSGLFRQDSTLAEAAKKLRGAIE